MGPRMVGPRGPMGPGMGPMGPGMQGYGPPGMRGPPGPGPPTPLGPGQAPMSMAGPGTPHRPHWSHGSSVSTGAAADAS